MPCRVPPVVTSSAGSGDPRAAAYRANSVSSLGTPSATLDRLAARPTSSPLRPPVSSRPGARAWPSRVDEDDETPRVSRASRRSVQRTPGRVRALRPALRTRRVRRVVHRRHQRPTQPRHRGQRPRCALQPRPPGCVGRRGQHRRRRRDPAPGARPLLPRRRAVRAARRRRLRRRARLPPARRQRRREDRRRGSRRSSPRRACGCSAGATCPSIARCSGPPRPA